MKDRLSVALDKAGRKVDELKGKATAASSEMDSQAQRLRTAIAGLTKQMEELRRVGQNASPNLDQSENMAGIEALEKQIAELESRLKQLDATAEATRTVPPELPTAKQQFNGLHMSIQQIAREMPSLAMGPQMFFLAISNNLPIFADEVKRARVEYDNLVKSGQKGVPVWKQILSSLFSWQTALTTGIMLLVMYGDEITDWVAGLFNARKAIDATAAEQRDLNAAMGEARASAARETAQLTLLYKMTQNTSASLRDRKAAVSELQNQYPAYFGSLSQEAILAGNAAGQYRQLANDILQAAYARAYQKRIESLAEQNVGLQRAINADTNWTRRNREEYNRRLERIRLSTESAQASAGSPTNAAAATATGILERQTDKIITEYERRTEALAKNKAQLETNEQAMQSYEQEVLKRQKPLLQTTLGKSYAPEKTGTGSDTAKTEAEKRKQTRQKLNDELLALEQQNQQDGLDLQEEGTQKKLTRIDADYERQKTEIEKKARELAELNRKAGVTGTNAAGLTDRQQEEIDRANTLAEDTRKKEVTEVYREEAVAMRDYLKEYGSYQQQKLAIAEEYAEKIRRAQSEGERLSLEKERDSAVNRLELSAIRQQIDWGNVFGNFGVMFREQVQPTIDRLKTIARSPEFQSSAGVDEMEALYGLISTLQQSETMWNGEIFRQINDDLVSYQNAMRGYMAAQQREIEATEELARAKQTLKEAEGSGDARSIEAAELYVGEAAKNLDKASRDVQMFGTQVQSTTTSLRESSEQAAGMFRNLESGLRNLSSGNLKGIGQGVMQLDKLFNGGKLTEKLGGSLAEGFEKIFGDSSVTQALAEGLGNSGLAGSIISAILSILDELAMEGIGGIVAGLTDTVLGAVSGIIDNIFSLELFQQIGESLLKGAANILDALSFGGLGKLVGNGDSDPHLEEDMERLSLTNEALIAAIESLTEEIKGSSGQQATELYEKQMARLNEAEAHTREQMQRSSSAYSNGLWGIGGKKSSNKKIDDAMSGNEWQRISEVVGRTIGEAADFWNLSSEEMAKVAREAPDLYAKIKDYADAGYKDAARYMDDYIAFAEKRKELEQAYYESITQVSFDSVYDSFIDMLMDMSSDWEDFSDDMSEYLMRALLKTKLDELLKTDMEDWYATFGRAMSNGELTDEEIEDLNKQWEELVKKGLHIRDSISEATGYTGDDGGTTQSGKPGGFAAMSQEQGSKLEGLFVSGQMHWASIDERMQDVSEQMGAAVDHLRRIEENTGASAKHLGEIKDEIKKIVRDGLKMK